MENGGLHRSSRRENGIAALFLALSAFISPQSGWKQMAGICWEHFTMPSGTTALFNLPAVADVIYIQCYNLLGHLRQVGAVKPTIKGISVMMADPTETSHLSFLSLLLSRHSQTICPTSLVQTHMSIYMV